MYQELLSDRMFNFEPDYDAKPKFSGIYTILYSDLWG